MFVSRTSFDDADARYRTCVGLVKLQKDRLLAVFLGKLGKILARKHCVLASDGTRNIFILVLKIK